jgi:hypothetical protein
MSLGLLGIAFFLAKNYRRRVCSSRRASQAVK